VGGKPPIPAKPVAKGEAKIATAFRRLTV